MNSKASFSKRLLAFLIDLVSISIVFTIVVVIEVIFCRAVFSDFHFGSSKYLALFINMMNCNTILIPIIYFSAFEFSKWQGGIGKKVLNIKVVDNNGDRIQFQKVLIRAVLKVLLYITCISILFTKSKTTFYDYILKISVIDGSKTKVF